MQINDILDDEMVADILSPIPKGDIDVGKIFSDEQTVQISKKIHFKNHQFEESSNGMLDELGSPEMTEQFEFLKNYDEDQSPFAKLVQSDALEFTVQELAKMNMKE